MTFIDFEIIMSKVKVKIIENHYVPIFASLVSDSFFSDEKKRIGHLHSEDVLFNACPCCDL